MLPCIYSHISGRFSAAIQGREFLNIHIFFHSFCFPPVFSSTPKKKSQSFWHKGTNQQAQWGSLIAVIYVSCFSGAQDFTTLGAVETQAERTAPAPDPVREALRGCGQVAGAWMEAMRPRWPVHQAVSSLNADRIFANSMVNELAWLWGLWSGQWIAIENSGLFIKLNSPTECPCWHRSAELESFTLNVSFQGSPNYGGLPQGHPWEATTQHPH